jgi:signal transduction histidine kinase
MTSTSPSPEPLPPLSPPTVATRVLTPGLLIGFMAMVVILIAAVLVNLANLRNVHSTSEAVAQTYSVKVAMQRLLTAVVDAETSERGFIITGDEGYLDPYDRGREAMQAELVRLRHLVADNREQRADLDAVAAATDVKLREVDEAIRRRRESGLPAAQAQVATNAGKRTMDRIRAIVSRMEAREDALLAARTAHAAQSYGTARLTSVGTTTVALLAVIALFVGTLRYGEMRLRATRAAEAQQALLREAMQQKDDFVALVSHELRTPTNTIVGWARMLRDGTISGERSRHAVQAIARNADSLRQLIEDLMDTSQLVSGRMRLTIANVDVRDVLTDAIDAVRLGADNKGVLLTEAVEPDVPSIRGDAARLKQVVWNLLANAIKFTPTGGHVTVRLAAVDGRLRLEVQDTGDGIDPAFLPHVFERYRQANASTPSHRGLGLGLAIVRHLVELHGGTVMARSSGLGQGSTFMIDLPLAAAAETPSTDRLSPVAGLADIP